MQETNLKPKLIHPLEFYLENLTKIGKVSLTHREVDVLACLSNGRSTKAIANLLGIAPKTVATHIYNSAKRFDCSTDRMAILIEESDQSLLLREHYVHLLVHNLFKLELQEIGKKISSDHLRNKHTLVYSQKKQQFFDEIAKDFNDSGLLVSLEYRKETPSVEVLTQEGKSNECNVYFIPDTFLETEGIRSIASKKPKVTNHKIIFLTNIHSSKLEKVLQEYQHLLFINPLDMYSYYFNAYAILEHLAPNLDLKKAYTRFVEKASSLQTSLLSYLRAGNHSSNKDLLNSHVLMHEQQLPSKKLKVRYTILGLMSIGVLLFVGSQRNIITIPNQQSENISLPYPLSKKNNKFQAIRSDLFIPPKATFLNRPNLIDQIEQQYKQQQDEMIKTVALVGMGGSGKTTLGHQYASSQDLPVVWEINAETKESLKRSFEALAFALAKSQGDHHMIGKLQQIENADIRAEEILSYVKERLRYQSSWLLIYDNVERFVDILRYFPHDPNTWGRGKVIVTTRDLILQANKYISGIICIGELTPEQKFTLFTKITYKKGTSPLTQQQAQEAISFLENLPPYPLDISVAGYYLTATNASFETYLENLKTNSKEFVNLQQSILKEMGYYTKSRYNIISISIQKLLDIDKEFKELLLLVSILNSQGIPKNLLEANKNKVVVEKFIFHLKRYSLLVNESSIPAPEDSSVSLHRSTQEISLDYINKSLDLQKDNQLLSSIALTLVKYAQIIEEAQNYQKMRSLMTHFEFVLNRKNMLTAQMKASIGRELGIIYFNLGQYEKAERLLSASLEFLLKHESRNHSATARTLAYISKIHINRGDYLRAKELLERNLLIYNKYFPQYHVGIYQTLVSLGTVYKCLGSYEKSLSLLNTALVIQNKEFPENHVAHSRILAHLGNMYRKLGNYEKAKELLEESLRSFEREPLKNQLYIGWVSAYLGNLYYETGEQQKAKDLLQKGFQIYKENYPHNNIDIAWISTHLARVEAHMGNYKYARELLENSYQTYKQHYPENHLANAWITNEMCNLYTKLGDYETAKKLMQSSLVIYENNYGKDHNNTLKLVKNLEQLNSIQHQ